MILLTIFIAGIILLVLGYKLYGKYLEKQFEVDYSAKMPSETKQDGKDFVPTKIWVLFGHHFSSIAGAGPIVGPITAALLFGWIPALLWIIVGCIFIGGMHDFAALVVSVRNGGDSISSVCKKYLNPLSYKLYLGFVWIALVYIIIVFCDLTASTFAPDVSGLVGSAKDTALKNGSGIAYASFFYIIFAMCFGILTKTKKISFLTGTFIFVPLVFVTIFLTQYLPAANLFMLDNAKIVVSLIILAYCFIASMLPVWFLLQPRDYLSSYLLFVCIILSFIGIIISCFTGSAEVRFEGWTGWYAAGQGYLFPVLFITIACGAISGFHSLVSSGTTSKQAEKPRDMKRIGYGAMIVEAVLALISLCAVMILARDKAEMFATPNAIFANGFGIFASKLGIPASMGTAFALLAISTFLLTTLDTCTRLGRYISEELMQKKGLVLDCVYTLLVLVLPVVMVFVKMKNPANPDMYIPVWKAVWPLFGATNQLLGALALLVIYIVRVYKKKSVWFVFVPMLFMLVTSLAGLGQMFMENIHSGNRIILILSGILLVLTVLICIDVVIMRRKINKENIENLRKNVDA